MSGTVNSAGRLPTPRLPNDKDLPYESLEERLRGLEYAFSLDTTGITTFDRWGKLSYVNPAFSSIYGIGSTEELSELPLQGLVAVLTSACKGEIEALKCFVPSRFHTHGLMPESVRMTLSSGKIVQISHHVVADGGWVTRHIAVGELGGQTQVSNELVSLQALIDQLPDYLWVKDTESRFVVANLALAMDSGRLKSADMIGLTDFDLHTAEKAAQFHARELEILRSGTPMLDAEEAIVDANGQEKWFSSSKIPLRNDSGDIVGLIGVAIRRLGAFDVLSCFLAMDAVSAGKPRMRLMDLRQAALAVSSRFANIWSRSRKHTTPRSSGLMPCDSRDRRPFRDRTRVTDKISPHLIAHFLGEKCKLISDSTSSAMTGRCRPCPGVKDNLFATHSYTLKLCRLFFS